MNTHYASGIFQHLEQTVESDLIGELSVHYARTVDHKGDLDQHRFVVSGLGYDDDLFPELADIQTTYNPDNIELSSNTRGAFIAFDFNDERISGAPPESMQPHFRPDILT